MTVGEKIVQARKQQKLSQEDVAFHLGVSRQTISNWENDSTCPDITQAKALAALFQISLDELCDHDIRDILLDKVSKTEKETGSLHKTLKVIGIVVGVLVTLYILFILIVFVSMKLYHNKEVTSKTMITCTLKEQTYTYEATMDDKNNIISQTGDTYIRDMLKNETFTQPNQLADFIEKEFLKLGGNCE